MSHTVKSFDHDLAELDRQVVALGEATEKLVSNANVALEPRAGSGVADVAAQVAKLALIERTCRDFALVLIAKRQPVAVDLRRIVAALRICDDYRRIFELASGVTQRSSVAKSLAEAPESRSAYGRLAEMVVDQLHTVNAGYRDRDAAVCRAVWERDLLVDGAYRAVFRSAVQMTTLKPPMTLTAVDLLFCSKNLERICDHVAAIADMSVFAWTGTRLPAVYLRPELVEESVAGAA
jgi:phosphate transport system protein